MRFRLDVPRQFYRAMIEHALVERPHECCGLLSGKLPEGPGAARVLECYPLVNVAASPVEFLSDPKGMFAAMRDMRARGLEVLAVYHSHPASKPVPSRTDRERNYSADIVNLIISLCSPEPLIRAWWLSAEGHEEADWRLCDDAVALPSI